MDRDGFRSRRSFAPVKEGEELVVKIEAVGAKGDGIAKKEGFVLFVPNAKEGDEVKVKVSRVLRNVGFADIVGKGAAAPEEEPAEESSEEVAEEQPAVEGKKAKEKKKKTKEEPAEETPEDTEDFGEE
ncbi:TRAM domain-containing protein [Candidatus Woesearchaeota archaeon]|nr:TRAM domain-containing protein [Candidatus Woesearchaeota archaeon]